MLKIDKQGRFVIPKQFRCDNVTTEVHFYYSEEEKLFYFKIEQNISEDEFFVNTSSRDPKNRVKLPIEIIEAYEGRKTILAKKGDRIYILPFKKD